MSYRSLLIAATIAAAAQFGRGPVVAADRPEIKIESPKNGESVQTMAAMGSVVTVKFDTDDFEIKRLHDQSKKDETEHDEGHIRASVDDGAWGWVHDTADPIVIAGLGPGAHSVTLELVMSNHVPYSPPVRQTVNFTVAGNTQ